LLLAVGIAPADTAIEAYDAMGIDPGRVLSGTVMNAKVVPGSDKQVVAIVTFFTGSRDKREAVSIRFEIFQRRADALVSIYSRDIGEETGGNVGYGDLQIFDLDSDGINEVIIAYDHFGDPLIDQRVSEVLVHSGKGFATVWSGPVKYDATRAARQLPVERRDRFRREIDLGATLRSRGEMLVFNKTVIAVAGESLAQPKLVQESCAVALQRE
jgi:hypothetical protein